MKKYTQEIKQTGRKVDGQPRKNRVIQYSKVGIKIEGERPARRKFINGEEV